MLIDKPRFPVKEMLLFGFLPSWLKVFIYRIKGHQIGKGVTIGVGSVLCGKRFKIGEHTKIGFFSFVRSDHAELGKYVSIGSGTMIDTPNLEVGDDTKINEQVFVGGLQFPDSKLKIGRNCQIMQMTFVNPTRSITIGDDTGIGGDCLLFGHTSWLSKFEGYPTDFKPIEIGSSVSIAWRVFVGAGAKIGDGAVIGANSLVNRTIPPRCLATGSPAKVVARAPYFPRDVSGQEKKNYLKDIVIEMTAFLQGSGIECVLNDEADRLEVRKVRRRWFGRTMDSFTMKVKFEELAAAESLSEKVDLYLSLRTVPGPMRQDFLKRRIMWIDIENKERSDFGNDLGEEVALYLKRYGVRLFRV